MRVSHGNAMQWNCSWVFCVSDLLDVFRLRLVWLPGSANASIWNCQQLKVGLYSDLMLRAASVTVGRDNARVIVQVFPFNSTRIVFYQFIIN